MVKEPNRLQKKYWYTDVTNQEDDKKVIKSGGRRSRFDVTVLTNTVILDPLTKNRAQPKTRQRGELFSMMHVASHRI